MLVLTRKRNQAVMIGNDVQIVVGRIRGSSVTLKVVAPKKVAVNRGEIWERKRMESMARRLPSKVNVAQDSPALAGTAADSPNGNLGESAVKSSE